MAKEIMSRRSFHSDRDFRGMLHNFDFDQTITGNKAFPTNDGLEAPRNSLEISSEVVDFRKKAYNGYTDVPIGYELRRSLTAKRTTEETGLKFPEITSVSEQRHKTPSLVARLMGLDALPEDNFDIEKKIGEKQSVTCPSRRHQLPEDGKPLPQPDAKMHFQGYYADSGNESVHFHVLEHPQEKQLQEFKKKFSAREALSSQNTPSLEINKQSQVQGKQFTACEKILVPEKVNEAREFLDALEFLHSNKEFFMKVLHDPNSLLARNACSLAKHGKSTSSKTSRALKEFRMQGAVSNHSRVLSNGSIHQLNQHKSVLPSDWRSPQKPRFQPDEDMPLCSHRNRRQSSLENDAQMPSRIVILKPNIRPHACAKPSLPSGYSSLATVNYKFLKKEGKELDRVILQDAKQRLRSCSRNSNRESHMRKEMTKYEHKDWQKEPKEIARRIVRQVTDNVNRKSKNVLKCRGTLDAQASISRQVSPQRFVNTSTGGMSDGEGYSTSSRRSRGQSIKSHSSLPNSPRLEKISIPEISSSLASEERRIVLDNLRSNRVHKKEAINTREFNPMKKKDALDEFKQNCGRRSSVAVQCSRHQSRFKSLDCNGGDIPIQFRNSNYYEENTSSNTEFDSKSNSPRVLSRSHSVPNRENYRERANGPAKHKLADASLLVGKISSLKNNLSLAKRKNKRNVGIHTKDPSHVDSFASAAVDTTTPRCRLPAPQHFQRPETTAWSVSENWSMLSRSTEFSEQYTNCMSTPEHDLRNAREFDARRDDNILVSTDFPEWGSATDAVDSCSETSLEKAEQPSPVSVLEAPFQAESPSPVDIQEGTTTLDILNELQLKLRLLHLDGAEMEPRSNDVYGDALEMPFTEPIQMNNDFEIPCQKETWLLSEESCKSSLCVSAHDISCSSGSEADVLLYIRDILVCSGLTRKDRSLVKSFSVNHGLDPSIFLQVERHYQQNNLDTLSTAGTGNQVLPKTIRRLIFDVVDEIILTKLGMPADPRPWVRSDKLNTQFMWTGPELIERVWAEVKKCFSSDNDSQDDTLEDLASKALSESSSWLVSQSDIKRVGFELEQRILRTLVEEVVLELLYL